MFRFSHARPGLSFRSPAEIADGVGGIESLSDPARYVAGIHSGLSALDRVAGGLRRGTLTVLYGLPGTGKTALALSYVRSAILGHLMPTAIYSPGLTPELVLLRLIAAETRIPLAQFTQHGLSEEQTELANKCWERLAVTPLHVLDSMGTGVDQLRRCLAVLMKHSELEVFVVDTGDRLRTKSRIDVAKTADYLAGIARDFHVAVLAVATRPNFRASINADLSAWDRHAHRFMELRGPSPELRQGNADWDAEVVVSRNHNGPTGMVRLRFNSSYLGFGVSV